MHLGPVRMRTSGGRRFDSSEARERCVSNGPQGEPQSGESSSITDQIRKACSMSRLFLLLRPVRMRTPKVRFRSRRPAQAQRRRAHHQWQLAKTPSKSQKTSLSPFPASCSLFCDIFHCIFLSMNRSFFAKLMDNFSIFRCAF